MGYGIAVTTTGGGGGTGTGNPTGVLAGIALNFHGSAAAGTDVTITRNVGGVSQTLLALTNVNTDGVYNPQSAMHLASDGSVITDMYAPFVLTGEPVTVTVAGAGGALTNAVKAYFLTVS
jgi:hypothetical protein